MELQIGQHPVIGGCNTIRLIISDLREELLVQLRIRYSSDRLSYIQDILATLC